MEWWIIILGILAVFGAGWIAVMIMAWIFLSNLYKVDRNERSKKIE